MRQEGSSACLPVEYRNGSAAAAAATPEDSRHETLSQLSTISARRELHLGLEEHGLESHRDHVHTHRLAHNTTQATALVAVRDSDEDSIMVDHTNTFQLGNEVDEPEQVVPDTDDRTSRERKVPDIDDDVTESTDSDASIDNY